MPDITKILHRRTDLSTFVVHLTRESTETSAFDNLANIVGTGVLEARSVFGWAKGDPRADDPTDPTRQSQRVVCFSETPLEHIHSLIGEITLHNGGGQRRIRLEPYGVAMTKVVARGLGANPVFYVDMNRGFESPIGTALDELRDVALESTNFHTHAAARILPFAEGMGRWVSTGRTKEWWWEREWRHCGDLVLPEQVIWLCPEDRAEALAQRVGHEIDPWLDPSWGLERIVAHLAGIAPEHVSPFHPWPEPDRVRF